VAGYIARPSAWLPSPTSNLNVEQLRWWRPTRYHCARRPIRSAMRSMISADTRV